MAPWLKSHDGTERDESKRRTAVIDLAWLAWLAVFVLLWAQWRFDVLHPAPGPLVVLMIATVGASLTGAIRFLRRPVPTSRIKVALVGCGLALLPLALWGGSRRTSTACNSSGSRRATS